MSLRGGRKPDVAIRSPKCFDYMGIWYKTEGFKDADCHGHRWPRNDIAYLIPDSYPESLSGTGGFECSKLFDIFLFDLLCGGRFCPNDCLLSYLVLNVCGLHNYIMANCGAAVGALPVGSATGRMYPAPTHSDGSAVGFGAPGSRALRW